MSFRAASAQSRSNDGPPEALYGLIRASIAETKASRISTRTRIVLATAAAPFVAVTVLLVASQVVYQRYAAGLEVGPEATSQLRWVLFLLVALALGSTLVALWRSRSGLGTKVLPLALVAGLAGPIYALLVLESQVHAHDPGVLLVGISPWGLRCVLIAAIVGVFVLASFTAALRRAVPAGSRLRGAAVGAAAGTWTGLTVFAFCPSSEMQHLLVGHVLPIVAFTILGGTVLPRALRP